MNSAAAFNPSAGMGRCMKSSYDIGTLIDVWAGCRSRADEGTYSQIGSYRLDVWWPVHTASRLLVVETDIVDVDAHVFSFYSANGAETGYRETNMHKPTFFLELGQPLAGVENIQRPT